MSIYYEFLESLFTHFVDDCIPWPFGRDSFGYPTMTGGKRPTRILCEHFNGKPPSPKHQAAHDCGNGHLGCVNGYHLYWATRKENEADKRRHGRMPMGEKHWNARLTKTAVRLIRELDGIKTQDEIAKQFGVSRRHISDVVNRVVWKHVD